MPQNNLVAKTDDNTIQNITTVAKRHLKTKSVNTQPNNVASLEANRYFVLNHDDKVDEAPNTLSIDQQAQLELELMDRQRTAISTPSQIEHRARTTADNPGGVDYDELHRKRKAMRSKNVWDRKSINRNNFTPKKSKKMTCPTLSEVRRL